MEHDRRVDARVASTLRTESDLINGAIELVASGGSSRVTVAGLKFGEELLEGARDLAKRRGVRVVPSFAADEAGLDLVVESIPSGR